MSILIALYMWRIAILVTASFYGLKDLLFVVFKWGISWLVKQHSHIHEQMVLRFRHFQV